MRLSAAKPRLAQLHALARKEQTHLPRRSSLSHPPRTGAGREGRERAAGRAGGSRGRSRAAPSTRGAALRGRGRALQPAGLAERATGTDPRAATRRGPACNVQRRQGEPRRGGPKESPGGTRGASLSECSGVCRVFPRKSRIGN